MPKMPFFAVWAGQMGGGAFLFLPMPWPVPGRRSVTRTAPLFKWGVSPTPFLDPTCPYIQPWLPPCEVVIHTGMVVIGLSCCCNSYSIGPALCSMIFPFAHLPICPFLGGAVFACVSGRSGVFCPQSAGQYCTSVVIAHFSLGWTGFSRLQVGGGAACVQLDGAGSTLAYPVYTAAALAYSFGWERPSYPPPSPVRSPTP